MHDKIVKFSRALYFVCATSGVVYNTSFVVVTHPKEDQGLTTRSELSITKDFGDEAIDFPFKGWPFCHTIPPKVTSFCPPTL